jgi:hypothetical protein
LQRETEGRREGIFGCGGGIELERGQMAVEKTTTIEGTEGY